METISRIRWIIYSLALIVGLLMVILAVGLSDRLTQQDALYDHRDKKRLNNPPVGLVTPDTDPEPGNKKKYQYDEHLDPQLVWAGKAERTSFEVPTVSPQDMGRAAVHLIDVAEPSVN